jgi:hypothetical protein
MNDTLNAKYLTTHKDYVQSVQVRHLVPRNHLVAQFPVNAVLNSKI